MDKSLLTPKKAGLINTWWLILAIWGLVKMTIYANNQAMYPIGFSLLVLGLLNFKEKKIKIKISYAFATCLILIYGMAGIFQSTQTMFAFLVSLNILLITIDNKYSLEKISFSFLLIPSICDFFAGVNKLLPSTPFISGEVLARVFEKNLIIEPSFMVNNILYLSFFAAILEVICGIYILVNPKKSIYLVSILHFPIAFFTAEDPGHLISLIIYSIFLVFCIKVAISLSELNSEFKKIQIPIINIILNFIKFLKKPKSYLYENLTPLFVLGIFQIIVPTSLLLLRVITGEVISYGFGWQMFSL